MLRNGADPKFRFRRGGWNKSNTYPIFENLAYIINRFSNLKSKIRLIEILVKNHVEINQKRYQSNRRNMNYRLRSCLIFELMDSCGLPSRIKELRNMYQSVDFNQLLKEKMENLRKKFD